MVQSTTLNQQYKAAVVITVFGSGKRNGILIGIGIDVQVRVQV